MLILSLLALAACEKKESPAGATSSATSTSATPAHGDHAAHGDHGAHGDHDEHAHHHHGSQAPDDVPADQAGEGETQNGEFFIKFMPAPNPIPHQQLFAITFEVYDAKDTSTLLESASIDQVRAIMPAHKHGMKVEPKITRVSPGIFKAEGMRFHMQGAGDDGKWVLEAVINDGARVDKTAFELQCCRQPESQ